MNNLLSYNGLIEARMRASDKDLPVCFNEIFDLFNYLPEIKHFTIYLVVTPHLSGSRQSICGLD